jgi:hypothetical protein
MPVIEVDEEEFKTLGRIRETVAKIAKDPEGKLLLQKAHKKVDPNAVTPDLDETEKLTATTSEWEKKFNELQTKIDTDKAEREKNEKLASLNAKMEAGRKALRDAGWTKEGIEGVEKLMEEKGILDHEIAAAYVERQNPPQEVMSPRAFGGFNFVEQPKDDDAFLKALLDSKGDDDNAVLKAAVDAVGEMRHGARR